MKFNYLNIIIFSLIFISCSNQEQKNKQNNNIVEKEPSSYLYIIGNKIAIKEYPPNGDIIFRLENDSKCKIIEKGKKQTILKITDYWYKVEYRNVKGWVFGAQTSEKLEKRIDYIQDFPFEKRNFIIFDELEYYSKEWIADVGETGCPVRYSSFFPLGWSKDGKIAFIKVENNADSQDSEIKTFFIIQDLDTDEILENLFISNNNLAVKDCRVLMDLGNDDVIKIRQHASLENSNKAWRNNQIKIESLFEKYDIIKNKNYSLAKRINVNGYSYKTKIELIRTDELGDKVNIYIVRSDGKRKLINKTNKIYTTSNKIHAYILKNPYKLIETIIYVDNDPYETNIRTKIIGTNLKRGFK